MGKFLVIVTWFFFGPVIQLKPEFNGEIVLQKYKLLYNYKTIRIFLIKHIYYLRREEEKRKECFCKNNLCHNLYSIVIVEIFMKEFDLGRRPHFLSFTFLVHCHYITGFDMSYV